MPRGDRTGPAGMGPMTGRGMGYCAGGTAPGMYAPGYGYGCGRGMGRGFRQMAWAAPGWGWQPPYAGVDAKDALADRAASLERELELVKKQLEALKQE
jgi:hypothetical protein